MMENSRDLANFFIKIVLSLIALTGGNKDFSGKNVVCDVVIELAFNFDVFK
jgi:hypothetical protein